MKLFNIFKKNETFNYCLTEEQKILVEKTCDEYLKNIAKEYDKKLHIEDGGISKPSFSSEENFYDWNKDGFVINFFSINQDSYFQNIKIFEIIATELKEKIKLIIDVEDAKFVDDCPIVFFKIINKNNKANNKNVDIKEIEKYFNVVFAEDYINFISMNNGFTGDLNGEYCDLWKLEDIIYLNKEYKVQEFYPNLIYFGSNGGDEAYAFDKSNDMCIVSIPFIGSEADKKIIANNFREFINKDSKK